MLGFILHSTPAKAIATNLLIEARRLDEQELLETPGNPERLYSLAASESALGNARNALKALDDAIRAGWIDYRCVELDPRFDAIRSSCEFGRMVADVKSKIQTFRQQASSSRQ